MSDRPTVSCITIFLDAEAFLGEALDSVAAQAYDDWELIMVDDGSRDDSARIAHAFAARFPDRARYVMHPDHRNLGMSASRALGVTQSRGRFISFLDADDVWLPDKLREQVGLLEDNPEVAMVYGRAQYWRSWAHTAPPALDEWPELGVPTDIPLQPPWLLTHLHPLGEVTAPCPSDLMLRRDVFDRIDGFDASFGRMYEDQVLLAQIYLAAPVMASERCWTRYRLHDNSCSARAVRTGKADDARRAYFVWLEAYLDRLGVTDAAIHNALLRRLAAYRRPWLRIVRRSFIVAQMAKLATTDLARRLRARLPRWLLNAVRNGFAPPPGTVRFGSLRRVTPISREYGFDRGVPIDRYYIERFLQGCAQDIRGVVLEVRSTAYALRFGSWQVTRCDVVDIDPANPKVTLVADLGQPCALPAAYDCIILTQTLQFIYDLPTAIANVYRALKPGGILLVTVPGISSTPLDEQGVNWCWYWRFTAAAVARLLGQQFPSGSVMVLSAGNVLSATGFLHGLAARELSPGELDHADPAYSVIISARAIKPASEEWRDAERHRSARRSDVPLTYGAATVRDRH